MPTFQKIGIISKRELAKNSKFLKTLVGILKKSKKDIFFDLHSAEVLKTSKSYNKADLFEICDLILVLGGDGTVLKSASAVGTKNTPILSINLGTLGFLTAVKSTEIKTALQKVFQNKFHLDKRPLLRITHYRKNKKLATFLSLNDAVINQGSFARLIQLDIKVDESKILSFKADGMIVATPTGSTAHSLSAGGPIVHHDLDALILTPICPSTLALRPIVISNNKEIKIKIATQRHGVYNIGLTLDGQTTVPLEYGDEIKIRKSSRSFYMVRVHHKNYYVLLREKLGWGLHLRD